MEFHHEPVLVDEVIEALRPKSGGNYLDGTLGGGGHAESVLRASSPDGKLWGMDRDQYAIAAASSRLAAFGDRVQIKHGPYSSAVGWVSAQTLDGVLLDLGVSSPQLDTAGRGFSLQVDGPLDMRMDPTQELTAAQVVNEWSEEDLADAVREWKLERGSPGGPIHLRFKTNRSPGGRNLTGTNVVHAPGSAVAQLCERLAEVAGARLYGHGLRQVSGELTVATSL